MGRHSTILSSVQHPNSDLRMYVRHFLRSNESCFFFSSLKTTLVSPCSVFETPMYSCIICVCVCVISLFPTAARVSSLPKQFVPAIRFFPRQSQILDKSPVYPSSTNQTDDHSRCLFLYSLLPPPFPPVWESNQQLSFFASQFTYPPKL